MQSDLIYDYFAAIILGIVEGLTEFIPVSSTAHLLLFARLIRFTSNNNFFEIGIQFGAILAVIYYYRSKFLLMGNKIPWQIFRQIFRQIINKNRFPVTKKTPLKVDSKSQNSNLDGKKTLKSEISFYLTQNLLNNSSAKLLSNLIISFIPAAVIGFFSHQFIKEKLFGNITIALSMIIGGLIIILIEKKHCRLPIFAGQKPENIKNPEEIPAKLALAIGFFQCLAMIPGISRSGATIIGAIAIGLNRVVATEFSFLLAVPTLSAAALFDFYKNFSTLSNHDLKLLAVGLISSFISSLLVIKFLINYVAKHDFSAFAYYRILLGLVIIGFIFR